MMQMHASYFYLIILQTTRASGRVPGICPATHRPELEEKDRLREVWYAHSLK